MKLTEELQREKLQIEIDKTTAEVEKIKIDIKHSLAETENILHLRNTDGKRFWFGVLAPAVSAFALVFTLWNQIHTSSEERELKRAADEATQWRSFLVNTKDSTSNTAGLILNRSFFKSQTYSQEALEVAANVYLPHASSKSVFDFVYIEFADSINKSNYRFLVDLTHNLATRVSTIQSSLSKNKPKIDTAKTQKLTILLSEVNEELRISGRRLKQIVYGKTGTHSKNTEEIILDNAYFIKTNFHQLNFGHASLTNTVFDNVNVDEADLSNISLLQNSNWNGTAWWRAKEVSKPLLKYLVKKFPYDPKVKYYDPLREREIKSLDDESYKNFIRKYNEYLAEDERIRHNLRNL
jgi:hypothetical protein